jgi:class 3 adenylate cyclase
MDHKVRGVVRISLGLEKLDAELQAARWRQVAIAVLTILGAAGVLVVSMGRLVLRPIGEVAAAARRIGSGDFAARVPAQSPDEIGQLGRVINDMAGRLSTAHAEVEARNAELAAALASLQESLQKVQLLEQLKGELSKFVPESVKTLLERNPDARELEKREADVSVVFLDVEGYTRLSEQLPPQRLNRMIQDYFSAFLEIIRAQQGDVNETAGDGLMVIFQDPDSRRHARAGVKCALGILRRAHEINAKLADVLEPLAFHVGVNSGLATVGATKIEGMSGTRWVYTASGPVTNVAARLAGLGDGDAIIVGPATRSRLGDEFDVEDLGEQRLRNVEQPVRVYRLAAPDAVPTGA